MWHTHASDDLARPKENEGKKGFTKEEREGIQKFVDAGFTDTFRMFTKGNGHYSWWSHFANARERNIGWRIDYFCISNPLKSKITKDNQQKIVEPTPTENLLTEETELVADSKKIPTETLEKLEKPIVIEFTLHPVPARTLVAQIEGDHEKNNGFEKILDKARDIKNGDSELGSLRDVKNELFAFDFRKDKTKRN